MGQFEKGNAGGPGGRRPGAGRKRKEVEEASSALFCTIPQEELNAVVARAVDQAKSGDATARAWLFDRVFGKVPSPDMQAVYEEMHERMDSMETAVLAELAGVSPELREKVQERLLRSN